MTELRVDDVVVRYPGRTVGPISFRAGPGVTHLIGPNGVGKSTILGVIATAVRRSSGRVLIDREDPESSVSARATIGYVPTTPLIPGFLTVTEAWRMMAQLRGRPDWDGHELCKRLCLPPDVRLDQASTGMQRKASLVAALAGDPSVLLIDETLANLDADSIPIAIELLLDRDATVVLTHHGALPDTLACARTVHLAAT